MSNQSEINNNTVEVSWRSEEGLQAKCGSNKENGALLENGDTSLEIAGSVIEQQVVFGDGDHDQDGASNGSEEDENNRLEVDGKVGELKAEGVEAKGDEVIHWFKFKSQPPVPHPGHPIRLIDYSETIIVFC